MATRMLETIIAMGGKIDPSLMASVKAAESMITSTANAASKAAQREQQIIEKAELNKLHAAQRTEQKLLHAAQKAELKKQQMAQKGITKQEKVAQQAALREQQHLEATALKQQQMIEQAALQRVQAEEAASGKIIAAREKEQQKLQAIAKKAAEAEAKALKAQQKQRLDKIEKFGKSASKFMTVPIMALGTLSVKAFTEFDDSIRQLQATLDATPAELAMMAAAAKRMGRDTKFTAIEAAGAIEAIGQAGYNAAQSIQIMPKALLASQAFGMSIEDTATYLTASMSTFGVTEEYLTRFTDQAAKAAAEYQTDTRAMLDASLEVGTSANYLKDGSVELFTMIGILSQGNVLGSEAGNHLNKVISSLAGPSDKAKKRLKALGVTAADESGNLRALSDIFAEIDTAMGSMGGADRTAVFKDIFGAAAYGDADALAKYAGAGLWDVKSSIIDASQGETERMATEMEAGVGGAMRSMGASWNTALIEAGEAIAPGVELFAGVATNILNAFSGADENVQAFIAGVGGIAAVVGPASMAYVKLHDFLIPLNKVGTGAGDATTKFGGLADKLGNMGTATKIGLTATAIAAAAVAIYAISESIKEENLRSRFGDIELSAQQIEGVSSAIKTPFTEATTEINNMFQSLETGLSGLKMTDLELKTSLIAFPTNPSQAEIETFAGQYNTYIDSISASLSAYSGLHQVEITNLLGEEEGATLGGKYDALFGGYDEQIRQAGQDIWDIFQEGLISGQVDKAGIRRKQSEIAQIMAEMEAFETRSELYATAERAKDGTLSYGSTTELYNTVQAQTGAALAEIDDAAYRLIGQTRALYGDDTAGAEAEVAKIRAGIADQQADLLQIQSEVLAQYMPDTAAALLPNYDKIVNSLEDVDIQGFMADYGAMQVARENGDDQAADAIWNALGPAARQIDEAFNNGNVSGADTDAMRRFLGDVDMAALRDSLKLQSEQALANGEALPQSVQDLQRTLDIFTIVAGDSALLDPNTGFGPDEIARNIAREGDLFGARSDANGVSTIADPRAESAAAEAAAAAESSAAIESAAASSDSAITGMATASNAASSQLASSTINSEAALARGADALVSGGAALANTQVNVTVHGGITDKFAAGATLTRPTLAWVAEGRDAETIVPHNNSARSKMLLLEAAAGVGMDLSAALNPSTAAAESKGLTLLKGGGASEGSSSWADSEGGYDLSSLSASAGGGQYVFAPQITVQGNADTNQLQDVLQSQFEQFKQWAEDLERERGRVSLGA